MNRIQRNLPLTGASLLAAGLMLGVAGTASAADIPTTASGNLTNVNGPVQTGSAAPASDRGNVTALLDFTVPSGAFGDDANALAGSSNSVDLVTTLSGTITNVPVFDSLDSTLNASKTFDNGMALADFLLGNSGPVEFASATLSSDALPTQTIGDPTAQILNATFGGDGSQTLANLISGTLDLAGKNDTLAGFDVDGSFTGSGTVNASGMVAEGGDNGGGDNGTPPDNGDGDNGTPPDNGGGNGGGVTDVPTPSGLGTMMLMGLGLVGIGAAKRRQGKNRGHTALAA